MLLRRSGLKLPCSAARQPQPWQWHSMAAQELKKPLAVTAAAQCQISGGGQPITAAPHSLTAAPHNITASAHSSTAAAHRPAKRRRLAPPNAVPAQGSGDEDGLWLIVGLGNPGATYAGTRHNVGFMLIDLLARTHDIDCRKLEKSAAVGRGVVEGKQVLLVKPMTFMNNSGESVSALAKFYKVPLHRTLVIVDDLDLPHAAMRVKLGGGHGGHNGLRSISERMGNTQNFPRIKIGIGRPQGQLPVASWVLQDFTKKEMEEVEVTLAQAADFVRSILSLGLEQAISRATPKAAPVVKPPKVQPSPALVPGQSTSGRGF